SSALSVYQRYGEILAIVVSPFERTLAPRRDDLAQPLALTGFAPAPDRQSDRFVVGGLGVFDLLEQVDGDADEVGVGDDALQFAAGDDRQTADTVPLEEQRGLSQA